MLENYLLTWINGIYIYKICKAISIMGFTIILYLFYMYTKIKTTQKV